ncbi:hypothetical protein DY000_02014826 [Brassica cretica]|uniref:Uncharacterized protein n=1 Tax=Brassica cretica TaxID=69181 RepID=A0ABQ7CLJ1_BRACR|nr:hypothetical protein DY000_02014826 [Brassica cretica]
METQDHIRRESALHSEMEALRWAMEFMLQHSTCQSFGTDDRPFKDDLEECGDFGVFWNLLSAELHRCIRCLSMYGDLPTVILSSYFDTKYIFELAFQCHRVEVNQHSVAEVIPILLKSGQSASQEEAVEEMNDCRLMTQHWCRSTVMPEYGLSIFL